MIWLLVIIGIALLALGIWTGVRGARQRRAEEEAIARIQPTANEAWEILSRPIAQTDEVPQRSPQGGVGDRRFMQGLLSGLGGGILIAALLFLIAPPGQAPQKEADTQQPSASVETPPTATPTTPTTPTTPAPTPGDTTLPPAPGGGTTTPAPPTPANVTIVVEEGDLPPTVADKLKAEGLIADVDAFLTRLTERGVDTLLQPGTFVVPTGATIDQVIDALIA